MSSDVATGLSEEVFVTLLFLSALFCQFPTAVGSTQKSKKHREDAEHHDLDLVRCQKHAAILFSRGAVQLKLALCSVMAKWRLSLPSSPIVSQHSQAADAAADAPKRTQALHTQDAIAARTTSLLDRHTSCISIGTIFKSRGFLDDATEMNKPTAQPGFENMKPTAQTGSENIVQETAALENSADGNAAGVAVKKRGGSSSNCVLCMQGLCAFWCISSGVCSLGMLRYDRRTRQTQSPLGHHTAEGEFKLYSAPRKEYCGVFLAPYEVEIVVLCVFSMFLGFLCAANCCWKLAKQCGQEEQGDEDLL
jgi:hypothetical protein